jgi:hypothetical protein
MSILLDTSGILLAFSSAVALIYEILALVLHKPTISDIVQRFGTQHRAALVAIEATVLGGLIVLAIHFLGVL